MPGTVNLVRFMTKEVIGNLLPVFLNGHVLKSPAKYLYLYSQTSSVLCLDPKRFSVQQTVVNAEIPGCLRYREQVTVEW